MSETVATAASPPPCTTNHASQLTVPLTGPSGEPPAEAAPRPADDSKAKPPASQRPSPLEGKHLDEFFPREPATLRESGLSTLDVESLVLKTLLNLEVATGRQMAEQLKLPFCLLQEVLHTLKQQLFIAYRATAPMSDYEHELTQTGVQRARRFNDRCTYCGAAPVAWDDYVRSLRIQSVGREKPKFADVCRAFSDLLLPPAMLSQIGQALNSGASLFLYGAPGNGKTSIAERVMRGLSQTIWIPRTITIGGEMIRLYDPNSHVEMPLESDGHLLSMLRVDRRWVRIRRPTVVVGGELTMEHLEITHNPLTGINEAPLQLKSNCGALVIDDFGRQRVTIRELLNRWIIPLERGYDLLSLPSGRQLQIPFEQLLVFATNIAPQSLVDEAFLRRIPYKIEVLGPTQPQMRSLFHDLAARLGCTCDDVALTYLFETHFAGKSREFRYCHARDLLGHVKSFCEFHDRPFELSRETIDIAVTNYFAAL